MPVSILLAYSTVYGSTREVAQFIADVFQKNGVEIDLKTSKEVRSLQGYRVVILGAPLYMFHWHKDAHRFLSRHQAALEKMPVAVFALGPFHNNEEELQSARTSLEKDVAKYPWLKPAATGVFVGMFDPAALRFPYSLIGPLKKMPFSDERNWDDIAAWCEQVRILLKG